MAVVGRGVVVATAGRVDVMLSRVLSRTVRLSRGMVRLCRYCGSFRVISFDRTWNKNAKVRLLLLLLLRVREIFCPRRRPHSGPIEL